MRRPPLLIPLFLLIALAGNTSLAANLTADQAKNHIGENVTVCNVVASTHYAAGCRGTPTFVKYFDADKTGRTGGVRG